MTSLVFFSNGGAVQHKVRVPGSKCKFSVWYDSLGYPTAAERIDRMNRSFPATKAQFAYLMRTKPAATYMAELFAVQFPNA